MTWFIGASFPSWRARFRTERTIRLNGQELDGKRPDWLTLIPWQCGKSLIWDVTVADTLAASHLATTSVKAGSSGSITAAVKKDAKYADLARTYHFVPMGLGRPWVLEPRLAIVPHNPTLANALQQYPVTRAKVAFFFQCRVSIALQRFNSIWFSRIFYFAIWHQRLAVPNFVFI